METKRSVVINWSSPNKYSLVIRTWQTNDQNEEINITNQVIPNLTWDQVVEQINNL
jgi:hypothetical protein